MAEIINWLHSSLGKLEHHVFKDVVKILDGTKKPIGDGQVVMISDIGRISLTLVNNKGQKKKIRAIVKCEASTVAGKQLAAAWGAFETEINMYTNVLKTMESLMNEIGDCDYLWAECYACADNKLLFQDLTEIGYKIVPTHKYLDIEHALIVMGAIGKYHALSLVMKERNILNPQQFRTPYYASKMTHMDEASKRSLNSLLEIIKAEWGPEWSDLPEKLTKYYENPSELVYNAWHNSKGKWDVLNHGDFSIRNMLFHYPPCPPGSYHPDGIKFVDFQLCHYSNLANDLITLLYSSLRPHIREKNMDLLLTTYVESLSSTAKKFNYQGDLPTVEDVLSSIKSLTPLIFSQILFSVPFFILSGKEDIQKKSNEFFKKVKDISDFNKANDDGTRNEMFTYSDKDVQDVLKFELRRLLNENVF